MITETVDVLIKFRGLRNERNIQGRDIGKLNLDNFGFSRFRIPHKQKFGVTKKIKNKYIFPSNMRQSYKLREGGYY